MANFHRVVLSSAILLLTLNESAWAYLDPGTGWMILQGFVATIAAAGVAVGAYWSKFRGWFTRRPKQDPQGAEPPQQKQE